MRSLKDLPAPGPSEAARADALAAAMAAFDAAAKKTDGETQENAAPGRLTLASTQTQRSRSMRANYFHYKIAASIAVLAVAVPAALYMYKQDMRSGAPAVPEAKPVAGATVPPPPGSRACPRGTAKPSTSA